MNGFWIILGDWGYALAAALFAALTIMVSRRRATVAGRTPLIVALTLTALWALHSMIDANIGGSGSVAGDLVETARNAAWLALLWKWLRAAGAEAGEGSEMLPPAPPAALPRDAVPLVAGLALALACQLPFDLLIAGMPRPTRWTADLFSAAWTLRAMVALGAIFLLRCLFARLSREKAGRIGWLCCALTLMWAYDFNHYMLAWISDGRVLLVGQLRGLVMVFVALLIALDRGGAERRSFALSRRATYRAIIVGLVVAYGIVLLTMVVVVRSLDDPATRIFQLGVMFALSVLALVLIPSAPFRGWLRVEIAKHLFTHRYDYRAEWMRFAGALSDGDGQGQGLSLRLAVAAAARALDAPAALLLMRQEDGALRPEADCDWPEADPALHGIDALLADRLAVSDWIVDIARPADPLAGHLPDWIRADPRSWALAPLLHQGALVGALLLARPARREELDWEDLDMLRVVARQLAATLSERRYQQALAEAQRFDEFNRRFAFILHDIKNMVSQISLLAGNAERHAENPAFRADMVLTLRETADRMNDLIGRLARPEQMRGQAVAGCDLAALARDVAGRGVARGRSVVTGVDSLPVRGDPTRLQQALTHLVQNAVEASAPEADPVVLHVTYVDNRARLDIIDHGCGMSAEFLRSGLFHPFASTKAGGFGLGAHEARTLVVGMGGTLDVASREGEGTRFTLWLPLLEAQAPAAALDQRKAG